MRLTDLGIRQLALLDRGQKTHWDDSLPGFGIRVGTRAKSYVVMFGADRRLKTIGRWPDTSLRDARKSAYAILAKPPPKSAATSDLELIDAFLDDCEARLKPSTATRYRYALAHHREKINLETTSPDELKALKAFFNWCIHRGYRDSNPLARKRVRFSVRERLLSDEEVSAILAYDHQPYSTIVRLLIYTGQRRGQISQFDAEWLKGDVIEFPSRVMKSNRIHTIPATSRVAELLEQLGPSNSWSKQKVRMDRHTGVSDFVLHDFRRYFSSTMAKLGVPLHVTEHLIDHRTQVTGVAEIYNRYTYLPEMREALETYECHLHSLLAR
jgi:integrase